MDPSQVADLFRSEQPTSTTATAEPSPTRRRETVGFDNVPVDAAAVFESLVYRRCEAKEEFQEGSSYQAGGQKPQKVNRDGVPVWAVTLAAVMPAEGNRREREGDIKVSWASYKNPAELFGRYQPVTVVGLRFGVTGIRRKTGNDFVTWWSADDIQPAAERSRSSAS